MTQLILYIFILCFLNLIFFLFGTRFYKIFISPKALKSSEHIYSYSIFVLLGMFTVGNILFLLNFFIPIGNELFFVLFVLIIFFERNSIILFFKSHKVSLVVSTTYLVTLYNNNPSTDAFMYHFYSQNLVLNSKIVFGISNFNVSYGIVSIFEYLSSILWVDNNYFLIQFLNLIVLGTFFNFIFLLKKSSNILLKNTSFLILFVGLLDNFGVNGGRNGFIFIQEIGKFDATHAILFFITFLYLVIIFDLKKVKNNEEFYIFLYLSTFLLQIRNFYYLLMLFFVIYLLKNKLLSDVFKVKLFLFINVLWIFKSIINTSCMVYPVNFTCLSFLPWSFDGNAKYFSNIATTNNRNPNIKSADFFDFSWVLDFWIKENYSYLVNILATILLIIFASKLFQTNKQIKENDIYLKVMTFIFLLMWFVLFPNYRFASGYFLVLYIVISLKYLRFNNLIIKFVEKIKIFNFLFILCFLLVPQISTYKVFFENYDKAIHKKFVVPEINFTEKNNSYGVKPDGMFCYNNINCSNSKTVVRKQYFYSYSFFIVESVGQNE